MSIISRARALAVAGMLFMVASAPAIRLQSGSQTSSASDQSKNPKSQPNTPTAADVAAAKASGKVWVNLDSGVYHPGGRWYGKTKNGKFMTVDDAKKAGYKPAKRD